MQGQNIIMMCQQNWDLEIGSNAKNLAKEFARYNQVLYVNIPLDLGTLLRHYRRPEVRHKLQVVLGRQQGLVQEAPGLWVYTPDALCMSANWLSSRSLFSRLNRINSQLLARSIAWAARRVGFGNYYLFQDGIIFHTLGLAQLLRPRKFIYYLRDYMLTVPYFQRHGPWVEAETMRQADVVVANSPYLHDYALQHNQHHSHYIGQGCALDLYQPGTAYPAPAGLADLARPLIGYTGSLTRLRLDEALLLALIRQRPNWSFVLVGPEDEGFRTSALHQLPNVHFLGRKPPEDLPAYVQAFDVCINPQIVNEITIGNYPLKIDEYLAIGKPVVATHTRTMEMFADHVYLADGETQWLAQLERALAPADPAQAAVRIAFAQSHTWAASVRLLYNALEPTIS